MKYKKMIIVLAFLVGASLCLLGLAIHRTGLLRGIIHTEDEYIVSMDEDCNLDQYNAIEKCNVKFSDAEWCQKKKKEMEEQHNAKTKQPLPNAE